MKHEVFAKELEATFKKHFPNGYTSSSYSNSLSETVFFSFGLIGDIEDCANRIRHNDPMLHKFCIFVRGDGLYEANLSMGALMVYPPEDSYLCMESVKTKFRKTKGDAKKLLKMYDRFFGRLVDIVKENADNIYGVRRNEIDPKYLEV